VCWLLDGVDFVFDGQLFLQVLDVREKVPHFLVMLAVWHHSSSDGEILVQFFLTGSLGPFLLVAANPENIFILLRLVLSNYDAMSTVGAVYFFASRHKNSLISVSGG
jgi:hypothetical protein